MADVVVQAQSTQFQRQGTTLQTKNYNLSTGNLLSYMISAFQNAVVAGTLSSVEQAMLQQLLGQDSEIIPGGLTLFDIQSINPDLFLGSADLQQIYQKDPFSTEYETNTADLYNRIYAIARSVAQSGPTNVRGGTARQGFELADLDTQQSINRFREIWQNQLAMAGLVIHAAQVAASMSTARYDLQLKAQQQQAATEQGRVMQTLSAAEQLTRERESFIRACALGGEFTSLPTMTTQENLEGQGFQAGVNTAFGMTSWR